MRITLVTSFLAAVLLNAFRLSTHVQRFRRILVRGGARPHVEYRRPEHAGRSEEALLPIAFAVDHRHEAVVWRNPNLESELDNLSSMLDIFSMHTPIESASLRPTVLVKVLIAAALFMAGVQLLAWFIANHPDSRWRVVAAVAPVAVAGLSAAAAWSSVQGMDERARRMHLEALAFAFIASLVFLMSYSFLALAEVLTMQFEMITPMMAVCWVIGLGIALWRYR